MAAVRDKVSGSQKQRGGPTAEDKNRTSQQSMFWVVRQYNDDIVFRLDAGTYAHMPAPTHIHIHMCLYQMPVIPDNRSMI